METIFTLPLFILLCLQTFISVLLLIPVSAVSLPVSTLLKKFRKSAATASAVYTVVGAVALLTVASMVELSRGAERVRASGLRGEVLGTVDFLRAQVVDGHTPCWLSCKPDRQASTPCIMMRRQRRVTGSCRRESMTRMPL